MENQNTTQSTELDLDAVKQKLKDYAGRVNDSFFDIILFIKRYIIAIVILFIAGVGLGIYLDKDAKLYETKIFVSPNFGSVDYVYGEIDRLQGKIIEHDTEFFASRGIKNPKKIARIQIEPVINIYEFLDSRTPEQDNHKLELFKIMSENGEIDKVVEDQTTARNYKYHVITITTTEKYDDAGLSGPILKALNTNEYWKKIQKESYAELLVKEQHYKLMIEQINNLLTEYGNSGKQGAGVSFYTDNTNLADLFNLKDKFSRSLEQNNFNKIDYVDVVKQRGELLNIKKSGLTTGNTKLILPILFLILFTVIVKFRDYYRAQMIERGLK